METLQNAVASVKRGTRGSYIARWYRKAGELREEATGEYQFERALRRANRMEAADRFWQDHEAGLWDGYAAMNYSPRFCWESFSHAKHLRYDRFRELLGEAGVEFVEARKWRDKVRPKNRKGRRYPWKGKEMTVSELCEVSGTTVGADTVGYRLKRGWDVERALHTPPMSSAESGRLGADAVNGGGRS